MNGTWVCVVVLSGNCNINFCFIAAWRETFSAGGCYRQHTHYFGLEEVQYFGFCILFNSDFFNLWSRLNCFLNCIRSIKHSDNVKARFQVEYDKNGGVWVLDFHLNLTRCNFSVLYYTWNTNLSSNTCNKETREEDECSYGTFHGVLENFICTCHDAFQKVRSHN